MWQLLIQKHKPIGRARWRVVNTDHGSWSRTLDEVVETLRSHGQPLAAEALHHRRLAWRRANPNPAHRRDDIEQAQTDGDLQAGLEVGALTRLPDGRWWIVPLVLGLP